MTSPRVHNVLTSSSRDQPVKNIFEATISPCDSKPYPTSLRSTDLQKDQEILFGTYKQIDMQFKPLINEFAAQTDIKIQSDAKSDHKDDLTNVLELDNNSVSKTKKNED